MLKKSSCPSTRISIHAPLAGCDYFFSQTFDIDKISIHAPLAGCDQGIFSLMPCFMQFQSTHPLRGATEEARTATRTYTDFNPRTPCGVRHASNTPNPQSMTISIHAPLAGCDILGLPNNLSWPNFNPRTPCGVRLLIARRINKPIAFQSTHPLRGATVSRSLVSSA